MAFEATGARRGFLVFDGVLSNWTAGGVTTTLLMPHRRCQLPSVRVVADALVAALSVTH